MATPQREEQVSVSFHYLARVEGKGKDDERETPLTDDEFEAICKHLETRIDVDTDDEAIQAAIRRKSFAPILKIERQGKRIAYGQFEASYWGHEYKNTARGKIPASSINLRPFFFYLYLAESGRLYVSVQYLGNYGGYTQFQNTVRSALKKSSQVKSVSFNSSMYDLEHAEPREFEISYSRKNDKAAGDNQFGKYGALKIRPRDNADDFKKTVKKSILQKLKSLNTKTLKNNLVEILAKHDLLELDDSEIESCKILVDLNGQTRTIYLISGYNFATQFPIKAQKENTGHPKYNEVKTEVERLLKEQIITKKENV